MIISDSQFGDLGWGWRSVGRVIKKVGKGAYNVAKMPAGVAKRVASATAGVLCDKNGNPRGSDSTSVNYCRAVKLKQQASLRKYLPGAAALASRASAVRAAFRQPPAMAGFEGPRKGGSGPCNRARRLWRDGNGQVNWAFNDRQAVAARAACGLPLDAVDYGAGRGFGDPDTNLLASLDGADLGDLSFALAGVTPVDIQGVTTSDVAMFAPALIAVAAGFWMATRG